VILGKSVAWIVLVMMVHVAILIIVAAMHAVSAVIHFNVPG